MIYITYVQSEFDFDSRSIKNVWNVDTNNVETLYTKFMFKKAKELNIIINRHWLNIMDYKNHNYHLTKEEYDRHSKTWDRTLDRYTIDRFIEEELNGIKEHFIEINQY